MTLICKTLSEYKVLKSHDVFHYCKVGHCISFQLTCGHVFHLHCCRNVLDKRWVGPRITFGFSLCPICKVRLRMKLLAETKKDS